MLATDYRNATHGIASTFDRFDGAGKQFLLSMLLTLTLKFCFFSGDSLFRAPASTGYFTTAFIGISSRFAPVAGIF